MSSFERVFTSPHVGVSPRRPKDPAAAAAAAATTPSGVEAAGPAAARVVQERLRRGNELVDDRHLDESAADPVAPAPRCGHRGGRV